MLVCEFHPATKFSLKDMAFLLSSPARILQMEISENDGFLLAYISLLFFTQFAAAVFLYAYEAQKFVTSRREPTFLCLGRRFLFFVDGGVNWN